MRFPVVLSIVVLSGLSSALRVCGADAPREQAQGRAREVADVLVASADEARMMEAVQEGLWVRDELVAKMIELVAVKNREKFSERVRAAAAQILGKLRAPEAAGPLAEALDTEPFAGPLALKMRGDLNPFSSAFVGALEEIGRPALPAIIEKMRTTENVLVRAKCIGILRRTVGGKRRALEVLTKLEARMDEERSKRNIAACRKLLEGVPLDEEPLY